MGFRYAPYDIANLAKINVTNKLGFKPGETMADQKIKSLKRSFASKSLIAVVLGVIATVVYKSLTSDKTVFEESKLLWSSILAKASSLRDLKA